MELFAQVVLPTASHLARDDVVNGFAFKDPSVGGPTTPAAVATLVESFYNDADDAGTRVSQFYSDWMDRSSNAAMVKVFDLTGHLDGTPHGSPIATFNWTLGAKVGSGNPMPEQVAVAVSYRAAYGSRGEFGAPTGVGTGRTRPRARRRGRVYLGPFHAGILQSTTDHSVISAGAVHCFTYAANRLLLATTADWCVWSRKEASLDAVDSVYVEPRFDTQRRRATRQSLLVFP